jgi:predicted RNase H-like nuclease (RuvC/YqgF family)
MISFFKKTLKVGVIALGILSLATVAAFAVVGRERTQAVVEGLHGKLLESIDQAIEDPSMLRAQLHDMEREYPKRIGQVRGDLAELKGEVQELQREAAISDRVVVLADQDLAKAEAELARTATRGETALAAFHGTPLDDGPHPVDAAEQRLKRIRNTRAAYASRAADARRDLEHLGRQTARLEELLSKLEHEHAEFQGQLLGLNRQIDSIARNDRLIDLLERRNKTLQECSAYQTVSLDQISGKLSQIRSRQEAELDMLSTGEGANDYENAARRELAAEEAAPKSGDSAAYVPSGLLSNR